MEILADENVDRPIVAWLRENGHDVVEVASRAPGATDSHIIELSREQNRILLTFDRDIGRIVLAQREAHPGVIYLRLRARGKELWMLFGRLWPTIEAVARGHYCTVQNHKVRRRPLPSVDHR